MADKDYYAVLGISEDASDDDITKAFRRLAKKFHPDRNHGDTTSEEKFKEINQAYEVLGDTKKRTQYDQMRRLGATGVPPGGYQWGGTTGAPGAPSGYDFSGTEGFDPSEPSSFSGSFSDIFEQFFGGGARPGTPDGTKTRERGDDVEVAAEIDFLSAVRGGKITLSLVANDMCSTCGGSGAAPGSKTQICPQCSGSGKIVQGMGGFGVSRVCPRCAGRGTIVTVPCKDCHGAGTVPKTKKIRISLRPGTKDGQRIRLRGQGAKGRKGKPSGDLYITFHVSGHDYFKRKGNDLYVEITINAVEAMLGTKVDVRTLEGSLRVTVPPGTQPGRKLRLRGKGIMNSGKGNSGDLYVIVKVVVPRNLSDEDRTRLQGFAKDAHIET